MLTVAGSAPSAQGEAGGAPNRASAAQAPIAGANPSVNSRADEYPPLPANTATSTATPNAPPSWRSML